MTVEARNSIGTYSNWSTTERSWKIGASPCPRRTSYKMNPQCGRSNRLLQIRPLCRQSRSIISWNWRRTRTSVCGTARAISPIEPGENWYVYRLHAISIESSVTRSLSYQNYNITYAEILVHQSLINANECKRVYYIISQIKCLLL